tara:strand:+ start:455 stop:628 length:174 start_codon:yes stop_codon:yes gene_type:complete
MYYLTIYWLNDLILILQSAFSLTAGVGVVLKIIIIDAVLIKGFILLAYLFSCDSVVF